MARTTVEAQLAKLRKAKEVIEKKEKALLNRSQDAAVAKIVQIAVDNGISVAQIAKALQSGSPAKGKSIRRLKKATAVGAKIPPKYRNPSNTEQTWTGRGRAPSWAAELKKAGKLDLTLIESD